MGKLKMSHYINLLLLFSVPFAANAHSGMMHPDGFIQGFLHPWSGLDHMLVMFAIGLWAVISGRRVFCLLPCVFSAGMIVGAVLGFSGVAVAGAEFLVAISLVAVGVLLSTKQTISIGWAILLMLIFSLGHGYLHVAEMTEGVDSTLYVLGFMAASLVLLGLGMVSGCFGSRIINMLKRSVVLTCTLTGVLILVGF